MERSKKRRGLSGSSKEDIIFYILLMAFPVLQFSIFYLGVNFNSLLLTFEKYDVMTNTTTWAGFRNLKDAFVNMTSSPDLVRAAGTSFLAYFIGLLIGTPLALLFSYYIYKQMPASGFFRVLLFLPSIISSIVMVTIFQFFVERAIPEIAAKLFHAEIQGLIENKTTRFATIMFYNVWVSFGVSILMYSDAMSGISPELVEAARLEGVVGLKEFRYITFPLIYPTFSTFFVVGVAGIFTNQLNLYSFFGASASESVVTYGYWLYVRTQSATSKAEYPYLAAIGVWLTVVAVPMTLLVRKLLERLGPSAE